MTRAQLHPGLLVWLPWSPTGLARIERVQFGLAEVTITEHPTKPIEPHLAHYIGTTTSCPITVIVNANTGVELP